MADPYPNVPGDYQPVTFIQEGNALHGYVDSPTSGQDILVISVEPEVVNNAFTGQMFTEIYAAIKHDDPSSAAPNSNLEKVLTFEFDQIDAVGAHLPGAAKLTIVDDVPFPDTRASIWQQPISAWEGGQNQEHVFLCIDISTSLSIGGSYTSGGLRDITKGIFDLMAEYDSLGTETLFTIVCFSGLVTPAAGVFTAVDGTTRFTADRFKSYFMENAAGNLLTQNNEQGNYTISVDTTAANNIYTQRTGVGRSGTNYTAGLEVLQSQISQSTATPPDPTVPDTSNWGKTVFFMSDGKQVQDIGEFQNTWVPFYQQNSWLNVYALGLGKDFSTENTMNSAFQYMIQVAGNKSHVLKVDDLSAIGQRLGELLRPTTGNLLAAAPSADETTLATVTITEPDGTVHNGTFTNGVTDEILFGPDDGTGNGTISMIVYENGDYNVVSRQNLENDYTVKLHMTLKDADGDPWPAPDNSNDYTFDLTIKDYVPEAYDKVSTYNPGYLTSEKISDFTPADRSNWTTNNAAFLNRLYAHYINPPTDAAIAPYTESNIVSLNTSTVLSGANVIRHIGSKTTLTEILNIAELTPSAYVDMGSTNTARVGLASRTISNVTGGQLAFNWTFRGICYRGEVDEGFWALFDTSGNLIDAGKVVELTQSRPGQQRAAGITYIDLPETTTATSYKLVIGNVQAGTYINPARATGDFLVIDTVVHLTDRYDFGGNVILDPSPDGFYDFAKDGAVIESITTPAGDNIPFPVGQTSMEVDVPGVGRLTIDTNGKYHFNCFEGVDYKDVDLTFKYHLLDADKDYEVGHDANTRHGTLRIVYFEPEPFDNIAMPSSGIDAEHFIAFSTVSSTTGSDSPDFAGAGFGRSNPSNIVCCTVDSLIPYGYQSVPTGLSMPEYTDLLKQFTGPGADLYGRIYTGQDSTVLSGGSSMVGAFGGDGSIATMKDLINQIPTLDKVTNFGSTNQNQLYGNFVYKTFATTGTSLQFAWAYYGGDTDYSFWLLRDSEGKFVQGAVLGQANGPLTASNGIETITIDPTAESERYTLVLGSFQGGSTRGEYSTLFISSIVEGSGFTYDFAGNVITDRSPWGEVDVAYADTVLATAQYGTDSFTFTDTVQTHTFKTNTGDLVVNRDGTYFFSANGGKTADVAEKFTYSLVGQEDPKQVATVYIQEQQPLVFDLTSGYTNFANGSLSDLGSFDSANTSSAWYSAEDTTAGGLRAGITSNVTRPTGTRGYPSTLNDDYPTLGDYTAPSTTDGVEACLRITGRDGLNSLQWVSVLGETGATGVTGTVQRMFSELGITDPLYVATSGTYAGTPSGRFAQRSFEGGGGGEIQFSWTWGSDSNASGKDVAMWFLKNPAGELVDYGLIDQLSGTGGYRKNGVTTINMPIEEGAYTITIGYFDSGTTSASTNGTTNLYLGAMIYNTSEIKFNGNVFTDQTPYGEQAIVMDHTVVTGIEYNGVYHQMTEDFMEVTTPAGGKLKITQDGSYTYSDASGTDNSSVEEDFIYYVRDLRGDETEALLSFRGSNFQVNGSLGDDKGSVTGDPFYLKDTGLPYLLNSGQGDDTITGGRGGELIYAGQGDDSVNSGSGHDRMYGGQGDDTLRGGVGDDTIYGDQGNDLIYGGTGNDIIHGGAGDNTLYGNRYIGSDEASSDPNEGSLGADTFGWRHAATDLLGKDVIMDFNATVDGDKLSFNDLLDQNQTVNDYLKAHITNSSLNATEAILTFDIKDGLYTKTVEMHFDKSGTDFQYNSFAQQYANAADAQTADQALLQFLTNISSN
jgi:hypothetical protein